MNVKPITPEEVVYRKDGVIPPEVIQAFNELITLNYSYDVSKVSQKEVVERIKSKIPDMKFDSRWLNVEEIYGQCGWEVEYDKPGYNETYEANFTFRKK